MHCEFPREHRHHENDTHLARPCINLQTLYTKNPQCSRISACHSTFPCPSPLQVTDLRSHLGIALVALEMAIIMHPDEREALYARKVDTESVQRKGVETQDSVQIVESIARGSMLSLKMNFTAIPLLLMIWSSFHIIILTQMQGRGSVSFASW